MAAAAAVEKKYRAHLSESARKRIEFAGQMLDQPVDYQGEQYFVTEAAIKALESYGPEVAAGDLTGEEATFWVLRGEGYLGLDYPANIDPAYKHPMPCFECGGKLLKMLYGDACLDCGHECTYHPEED